MLLKCSELCQVWSPLSSCPRSQLHSTAAADCDGFQNLGRSSLPPGALSPLAQICPEGFVSVRQPCLMLWRTSRHVQNGKQKAAGDSVSRAGIWLALCELAMKGHGWTDHKPSPVAHHWYHSVSETLRNTVQKPGFPAPEPRKTGLLYYSCGLIVQH